MIPDSASNRLRPVAYAIRQARLSGRMVLDRFLGPRMAPGFLIIGAKKAGTTSLFNYIGQHANFRHPIRKEIDYFSFDSNRGMPFYLAHFPRRNDSESFTGEASTSYLYNPRTAQRVLTALPDVKIIVLLRHPRERTLSHYYHEVRAGRETRSLAEALRAPEADTPYLLTDDMDEAAYHRAFFRAGLSPDAMAYLDDKPLHRSYLSESRYAQQLRPWLQRFDRSQILILQSENLFDKTEQTLAEVLDFIGVDAGELPGAFDVFNSGRRQAVEKAEQDFIEATLADSMDELEELIGPGFRWESG